MFIIKKSVLCVTFSCCWVANWIPFLRKPTHLVLYAGRRSVSLHVTSTPWPLTDFIQVHTMIAPIKNLPHPVWKVLAPIQSRFINSFWKPHLSSVNWTPLHIGIVSTAPPSPANQSITVPPTIFAYHGCYVLNIIMSLSPAPQTLSTCVMQPQYKQDIEARTLCRS